VIANSLDECAAIVLTYVHGVLEGKAVTVAELVSVNVADGIVVGVEVEVAVEVDVGGGEGVGVNVGVRLGV